MEELMAARRLTERCARLEVQRDQLREALEMVLAVTYGGEVAHKQKTCPVYKAARAALKATEDAL